MFASQLVILLLVNAGLASLGDPGHDSGSNHKHIFLLAGQSNMAGRGGVVNQTWDGVVQPQCRSNPRILRLNAGLAWVVAHEPLHIDIDFNKTCGVGPAMAFTNSLLEKDTSLGTLALVPCAKGGTNISEWARGTYLYNRLVSRAAAALEGGGGTIRALLWYQGESDTVSREDARSYKARLEKFFVELRADLGDPLLPIFQVGLASGEGHYVHIVRKAQLGIEVPNVRNVDAKGLELQPDGLHLTTLAQVRLGEMLARAFLQSMPIFIPS